MCFSIPKTLIVPILPTKPNCTSTCIYAVPSFILLIIEYIQKCPHKLFNFRSSIAIVCSNCSQCTIIPFVYYEAFHNKFLHGTPGMQLLLIQNKHQPPSGWMVSHNFDMASRDYCRYTFKLEPICLKRTIYHRMMKVPKMSEDTCSLV